MLNTVCFEPGQRSLFLVPVSSANTTEKRPLLAGNEQNSMFNTNFNAQPRLTFSLTGPWAFVTFKGLALYRENAV